MKIFKFWAIALVAMLGFTACEKHECAECAHDFVEVDYTNALVGTWTCMDNDYAEALVIKADGTVEATGVVDHEYFSTKGTIKVVNNKMIYKLDNGDEFEGLFEIIPGKTFSMVIDHELDFRFTYQYCENDLADEILGVWVCNDGSMEGTQTFRADGTSIMTGVTPVAGVLEHRSTYKVIGDLLFLTMPENFELRYSCARLKYSPKGTAFGDIMTHQSFNVTDDFEVIESTSSFLRVKEELNLEGKVYDYSSAYVSSVKGADEDFTIAGLTFNIAKMDAGDFNVLFRSALSCLEFNANSVTQKFFDNDVHSEFDVPMTVEGNKVTFDFSAGNPALRKVEMYMFQDADDSQLHIYTHGNLFVDYFANLAIVTLLREGKLDPTDTAAVEQVFADMDARIETINASFVYKARN